jgi:hypothetical protein
MTEVLNSPYMGEGLFSIKANREDAMKVFADRNFVMKLVSHKKGNGELATKLYADRLFISLLSQVLLYATSEVDLMF